MTEVEQPPPQNGIDLSAAEDDDSSKARPADIEQDMREMERRKRVEAIMGSKLFREELERIVDSARDGGGILQQLSDIMGVPTTARVGNVFKATNCMLPINDIRGVESMGYAKGEKILRCKLAATFRLLDLYGWTQGLGAQITARLKVDQENFLVNPYGLMYHEITASSLNKVDMQGQIVEQGTTNFGVNKNHFALHSVVHAARPDIRCAIYIGCSPVVAVSSLKVGLLPLTRDACVLGEITTHTYTGTQMDDDERDRLVRALGPNSKVLILSNYGALCCGETIEEAFFAASHIVKACETQLQLLPVGVDNLVLIPEESRKVIYADARRPPEDLEKKFAAAVATIEANADGAAAVVGEGGGAAVRVTTGGAPKWRVGGAEFEALMRMLDNAGYRTGYIYRHPLIKSDPPKPKNDVELPPAVSSLGYLLEEEELLKQGIWKKGDLRKGGDRSRWLNSPNVYQKVEVLETGTPDPKKITKWVAEGSPTHSTPVRIEDALQFVPAGTNPKEFKRLQQQIKDNRRADKISAGPQSHILEGVTWDEANRIKDATVSSAGDHVVLMGAASKGIIQRGYQHNATVYKTPYAKNPFDNVTDDELNEYKRTVERKKKSIHGEYTDTDFSESEPLSSLQTSGAQQQAKQTTTTTAVVSLSEPEDVSEHQVMRIETQQAPVPSQPEVVLSDAITNSYSSSTRSLLNYNNSTYHPFQTFKPQKSALHIKKCNSAERHATILGKYAFLYRQPFLLAEEHHRQQFTIFNIWMIHKIEIFPHYTYPLPEGECKIKVESPKADQLHRKLAANGYVANNSNTPQMALPAANAHNTSTISTTSTTPMQPYRTCSHYGFNYPLTYQPNISIHPAHLLTAVQLQRQKVIAFIKSTAMNLNTGYFQQRLPRKPQQPRAPRLRSCDEMPIVSETVATQALKRNNSSSSSSNSNNIDSNGSYISVKEIQLEPARRRNSTASDGESVAGYRAQQQHVHQKHNSPHHEHDDEHHKDSHNHHDLLVFSDQLSSLFSLSGTSYPAGSHSHTADLAHEREAYNERRVSVHHPHSDDSVDNNSSIFTHATPTTPTAQRVSYVLRDFLPPNAQTHERPEHKPEAEQALHATELLTTNATLRHVISATHEEEESDGVQQQQQEQEQQSHHTHKQIKLTLNANAKSATFKRRCSHSSQEASNAAQQQHEHFHQTTAASLSEADSSSAVSSLRSLEIHININVRNSDCARTLQTHEVEFRHKLERIVDEEINLIAQQLSGTAATPPHHDSSTSVGGVNSEPTSSALLELSANAHRQHSHATSSSDLRFATSAAGQQRKGRAACRQQHYGQHLTSPTSQPQQPPPSIASPYTDADATTPDTSPPLQQQHEIVAVLEQELDSLLNGIICANALHNHAVMCDCRMKVAQISEGLRTSLSVAKQRE